MLRLTFLFLLIAKLSVAQQIDGVIEIHCDSSRLDEPARLLDYLKGKEIVALGEATHGTHEFFTIKNELIKDLVSSGHFKVIAFETDFSAYEVNQYLSGKSDDLPRLMSNFYLVYHTAEFVSLLKWIRTYNLSVKADEQVVIYGFDSQHVGNLTRMITDYIQKVDPQYLNECTSNLSELNGKIFSGKKNKYLKAIKSIEEHVQSSKIGYIKLEGERSYTFALQMMSRLKSAIIQSTVKNSHGTKSQTMRDSEMLENVKWIKEFSGPDSKIILWAHNGHIQTKKFQLKKEDHFRMGEGLREQFLSKYYVIGFDFGTGSFNAVNYQKDARMQPCIVTNVKDQSFAAEFSAIPFPCYLANFALLPQHLKERLQRSMFMREAGVGFSGEQFTFVKIDIINAFDAMIFIKKTTPSQFIDARKIR
ncbi:MAG TPA: erythromycin esterase family protein [Cyclobacteriaceae bacterium]|nr:erythromycin esterase family protein [Cyclobacteriaceae bacterium]HMV10449.1 erythromycin esterase family protein [Cyclobacteriaceae bacterium]HMX01373.1 erythromycin esterase family protein [Cyclobacteriaceae bacterium]HMX50357.1 erythromycin esterase family protein [Cyclobacteriaceae bacterium]HMY92425.1 erythromycin esterase family protein [Cyclobacteriaceae bacterium]